MKDFKTWWEKRNFYGKYAAQQSWDASRQAVLDEIGVIAERKMNEYEKDTGNPVKQYRLIGESKILIELTNELINDE